MSVCCLSLSECPLCAAKCLCMSARIALRVGFGDTNFSMCQYSMCCEHLSMYYSLSFYVSLRVFFHMSDCLSDCVYVSIAFVTCCLSFRLSLCAHDRQVTNTSHARKVVCVYLQSIFDPRFLSFASFVSCCRCRCFVCLYRSVSLCLFALFLSVFLSVSLSLSGLLCLLCISSFLSVYICIYTLAFCFSVFAYLSFSAFIS